MGYRIAKVTSFYRNFLDDFYRKHAEWAHADYATQHKALMQTRFAWSDFYAQNFARAGIEATEIVANAMPMQHQWVRERGGNARGLQIVMEQLKALRPHVVWLQDSISQYPRCCSNFKPPDTLVY